MRRFIAYIILTVSILLGIAIAFVPVSSLLTSDMNYSNYYEVTYQLSDWDEGNTDLDSDENAAYEVAQEMSERLEDYDVAYYEVEVVGNDMVKVRFNTEANTDVRTNIEQYLAFSGGNFTLTDADLSNVEATQDNVFYDSEAYIEYDGYVPYVIIPVSNSSYINTLIDLVHSDDEESEDEDSDEETTIEADIYLWANLSEDDSLEKAEMHEYTANKIIASFYHEYIWYEESDDEETEIVYLCGYEDEDGNYDVTRIEEANNLALRVKNFFNASSYDYEVTLLYEESLPASVETLVSRGSELTTNFSLTLIASLVAFVIVSIIMFAFYRLLALGMVMTQASTLFLTMTVFIFLGSTFGVAALVAIAALYSASIFLTVLYANRFKEEVYKGRSLKKANQEASKKITMPTIDLTILFAVAGLLCYFVGGTYVMSSGVVLFFGGVFLLLVTLLLFKLSTYLLTNANNVANKYKLFYIDKKLVPDLSKEEKPSYKAPFEDKNFTKHSKKIGIAALILMVASIAGISTFAALNNGNFYNSSSYEATNTEVYVVIDRDDIPYPHISDETYFEQYVLPNVYVDGAAIEYEELTYAEYVYNEYVDASETGSSASIISTYYDYYVVSLEGTYEDNAHDYAYYSSSNGLVTVSSLEEAFNGAVSSIEEQNGEFATVREVTLITPQPNNGFLALAVIVFVVAYTIYLGLRYNMSRAVASGAISLVSSLIVMGFFALTRIPSLPIAGVAIIGVSIYSLILSLVVLNKDKELRVDAHHKLNLEERKEILTKALATSVAMMLIFGSISAFIAIAYFGFGPFAFATVFGGLLLGIVLSTILVLTTLLPLSNKFDKWFNKFANRLPKRKKVRKEKKKSTSNEPEETIFIGINDY